MLEALDEGLSSLGESSKQATYFDLEKTHGIRREEIRSITRPFSEAIGNLVEAGCLEILIIQRLYERVGAVLRWDKSKGFSFVEYISIAKQSFQEKTRIKTIKELVDSDEERMGV
jgi:hypothetical protein